MDNNRLEVSIYELTEKSIDEAWDDFVARGHKKRLLDIFSSASRAGKIFDINKLFFTNGWMTALDNANQNAILNEASVNEVVKFKWEEKLKEVDNHITEKTNTLWMDYLNNIKKELHTVEFTENGVARIYSKDVNKIIDKYLTQKRST